MTHECTDPVATRIAIEYSYDSPHHYDGVSVWACSHGRFGRWCGRQLADGEVEPRFCDGSDHPRANR